MTTCMTYYALPSRRRGTHYPVVPATRDHYPLVPATADPLPRRPGDGPGPTTHSPVVPAKAGTQCRSSTARETLDPRLRGEDAVAPGRACARSGLCVT